MSIMEEISNLPKGWRVNTDTLPLFDEVVLLITSPQGAPRLMIGWRSPTLEPTGERDLWVYSDGDGVHPVLDRVLAWHPAPELPDEIFEAINRDFYDRTDREE
jgi:hypothetical protein